MLPCGKFHEKITKATYTTHMNACKKCTDVLMLLINPYDSEYSFPLKLEVLHKCVDNFLKTDKFGQVHQHLEKDMENLRKALQKCYPAIRKFLEKDIDRCESHFSGEKQQVEKYFQFKCKIEERMMNSNKWITNVSLSKDRQSYVYTIGAHGSCFFAHNSLACSVPLWYRDDTHAAFSESSHYPYSFKMERRVPGEERITIMFSDQKPTRIILKGFTFL